MITARIETEARTLDIQCDNNKENAISRLQDSVSQLSKEDGRCKFIVLSGNEEIYSWYYQPTIREDRKTIKKKVESKYGIDCLVYVLLNGKELNYDNLFLDESFYSVKQARDFMKDRGYSTFDYKIVYEYIVFDVNSDTIYGTGLGFTKEEATIELNKSLEYYSIQLKNNRTQSLK